MLAQLFNIIFLHVVFLSIPPHLSYMSEKNQASLEILADAEGVRRVRLVGKTWADQESANRIYQRISHLIDQIDRTIKSPQPMLVQ